MAPLSATQVVPFPTMIFPSVTANAAMALKAASKAWTSVPITRPRLVRAAEALLAPVPPSATARSVMPAMEPPVIATALAAWVAMVPRECRAGGRCVSVIDQGTPVRGDGRHRCRIRAGEIDHLVRRGGEPGNRLKQGVICLHVCPYRKPERRARAVRKVENYGGRVI